MPVRKTESRIPAALQAADLGQSVAAADGKSVLVSQIASPLVQGRDNVFVVFVTDAALAGQVASYEWQIAEAAAAATVQTTTVGELAYRPAAAGALSVQVTLKGGSGASLGQMVQNLEVIVVNAELETLISEARNRAGPAVSNPEVARELINDLDPYYHAVRLAGAENADFTAFVFMHVHDALLQKAAADRKAHLERLAAALNSGEADYGLEATSGAGVSGLRIPLLAMVMPQGAAGSQPAIAFTELAENRGQHAVEQEALMQQVTALPEATRIDLFNCVRFPKSNVTFCARVIEALRDRYFAGVRFDQMSSGFAGMTRAHWMIRHYREGPIRRN